jgi:hypothetical protein
LLVVGGFLAVGGAVMIFVWLEKDESALEARGPSKVVPGVRMFRRSLKFRDA